MEAVVYRVHYSVLKRGKSVYSGSIKLALTSQSENHAQKVLKDQPLDEITDGFLSGDEKGIKFEIHSIV